MRLSSLKSPATRLPSCGDAADDDDDGPLNVHHKRTSDSFFHNNIKRDDNACRIRRRGVIVLNRKVVIETRSALEKTLFWRSEKMAIPKRFGETSATPRRRANVLLTFARMYNHHRRIVITAGIVRKCASGYPEEFAPSNSTRAKL